MTSKAATLAAEPDKAGLAVEMRQRGLIIRYVTLHIGSTESQLLRDLTWVTQELVQRYVDMNLLRRTERGTLCFNGSWMNAPSAWDDSSAPPRE